MADLVQHNTIDFRRGGDTVHDFTEKYMDEIQQIYDALTSLRGNAESPSLRTFAPAANQWYVDGNGNIYIRSKDNTEWNFIGKNQKYLGNKTDADGEFLKESNLATEGGGTQEGKIPVLNAAGVLPFSISGNAGKIAGYSLDLADIKDGEILSYSASENKIIPAKRVQTGDGNVTFSDDKPVDGSHWIAPIEDDG